MKMEDGSSAEAKTWGFRRSTIARREFLEAVGSSDNSPPAPRARGRARGRGRVRGRGRGKRAAEAGGSAIACKRGRGGRGRALTHTGDEEEDEQGLRGVLAELKPDEERVSAGVSSDRAEDSDDLNLQEIRKRVVARRMQEQGDEGDVGVGTPILMGQEDGSGTDVTGVLTSGAGLVCSSDGDSGAGQVCSSGAGQVCSSDGDSGAGQVCSPVPAERAEADSEEQAGGEDQIPESRSESTGQDGVCVRVMLRCGSCREWRHVECVSSAEARLLQGNREEFTCASCSQQQPVGVEQPLEEVMDQEEKEEVMEQEVKVEEESASPKCMGPGCSNDALPGSVYCGHQCIVRHAAVAMKSLSEPKTETKPAAPPAEPAIKSEKRSFLAKLFKVKISKTPAQEEHVIKPEEANESPLCSDPDLPATSSTPAPDHKPTVKDPAEVEHSTSTAQLSDPPRDRPSSEETPPAPLIKRSTPARAKKTMPGSPRLELLRGALSKSPLASAKRPSEGSTPAESPSGPSADEPALDSPLLIRQHMRRELSRVLLRFNQSDDLNISEDEIEKLAVHMEKEMFNVCYTTDEEYRNKHQCLVLSLKDPKNKELCHQVLKGNMPSVRLINLSQQDMTCVEESSVPEESSSSSVCSVGVEKPPPPPPPPAAREEEVIGATTQALNTNTTSQEKRCVSRLKPAPARDASSGAPGLIGCMLKDSTTEHKHHLFDLNCRICTGQVSSDNDPETKKPKMKTMKDDTEKEQSPCVVDVSAEALESAVIESPASPSAEDLESQAPTADFSPVLIPAVPTVSLSRRDPRTAQYRQTLPSSAGPECVSTPHPQPARPVKETHTPHVSVHPHPQAARPVLEPVKETHTPHVSVHPHPQAARPVLEPVKETHTPHVSTPHPQPARPVLEPVKETHTPHVSTPHPQPARPVKETHTPHVSTLHPQPARPVKKTHTPHVSVHPHLDPARPVLEPVKETHTPHVSVHLPAPMPKSILTKPSPASLGASYGSTTRRADCDKGTRQFLSKQNILWKGFLNMPTVAKFVTKGYLISGSAEFLKEDLPDTIQVGGRILPQTVWEYVDLIKTSEAKELSLIRFHPASEEEEVAYVSLFSYFNSRRRFGVVSNICKHIKDLYLIPLSTKQSIPAALLPIEGPGLEQDHPNILMGLAVCQKMKRLEGLLQDVGEKKSRPLICVDKKETGKPTPLNDLAPHNIKGCDADIFLNSNPSGSLPSVGLPDSSCSLGALSSLPRGFSVSKPTPSVNAGPSKDSTNTTPLQTILNTLFGQKKQPSDPTECNISSSTDTVQPCQQISKHDDPMELGDDRPYDPEEYDPAMSNGALVTFSPTQVVEPKVSSAALGEDDDDDDRPYDPEEEYSAVANVPTVRNNIPKTSEAKNTEESSMVTSDVAYDPEDETVFEEMQNYLTSNSLPHKPAISEHKVPHYNDKISSTTLSEQQRILEELNRQIEEQKRQLEEQTESLRLQKEAIGVSMAHFSVSDALMSPPTAFGREEEEEVEKTPYCPMINQNRDPRMCRKASQDVQFDVAECEAIEKETAQKLLNLEETKKIMVNKALITKKEKVASDTAIPKEGTPETVQLQDTKCSRSENTDKKGGSRRSTSSSCGSSRRRSWGEHKSDHKDRASSRASHTARASKDVPEKAHRSRPSAERSSRGSYSDRRREASSRTRHRHPHRDSSSPSRYRRRSRHSTPSRSSRRDRSALDDSGPSRKTEQEPGPSPELSAQSSVQGSDSVPGREGMQHTSGHSESAGKDKHLAGLQQGGSLNRKHEADQRLQTFQNPDCSPLLLKKSFDRNQPFSRRSEMMRDHLPPSRIDSSSKEGPLLPETDLPLHRVTPASQTHTFQTDAFPHESIGPSNPPPHNRTAHFPEPGQIEQKRGMPSVQRSNYLQNETDKLHPGDYTQRAFHSQHRRLSQPDSDQFYCGELPRNKRDSFFLHDSQPCASQKEEEFSPREHDKFEHQKHPHRMSRRFPHGETDQVHQAQKPRPALLHEGNFPEEPETDRLSHKRFRSHMQEQNFHKDESVQFERRESILGPVPVHKGDFRPPGPRERFQPSPFDEWEPSGEHPPVSMRKPRRPRLAQSSGFEASGHASPQDMCEPQGPDCPQTFAEEAEDPRAQTCFPRRAPTHAQDPHGPFEGRRYPEGPPRGFRGHRRGVRGTFFARGHQMNDQMRGPRFDSPQQFLGQREPSPDLHGPRRPSPQNCERFDEHNEAHSSGFPNHSTTTHFKKTLHQNPCEVQNLGQPPAPFERQLRPTNIRPLRRSGPLLPTPPGGPINPSAAQVHRHGSHSECERAPAHGHGPQDSIREENNSFKHPLRDTSEGVLQEEGYESRPAEPSVRDRSYGQACRRSRGRGGRFRGEKRPDMWR
ncbi:death-inducer obliterator 1 [Rhinichthys klamathensis goyatoka]|uniref:death-inducer obliterator 1 n=1 Tax=Rhinichthys klamathensis goyatoka TaxID=3034132 RepID=UPI0024B602EA|nr:death-inducer obliterator 1 [Rhinichthys klamathensis goyatoka]